MNNETPEPASQQVYVVDKLIDQARQLARAYREATGRPLPGVSGEIANHDAMQLLGLKPAPSGSSYDASGEGRWLTDIETPRSEARIQIKGRVLYKEKPSGQRIGQLKLDKEWEWVVLVLYDGDFQPNEIWAAARGDIEQLAAKSSQNRSRRGALSVASFRAIGELAWSAADGVIDAGVWSNS